MWEILKRKGIWTIRIGKYSNAKEYGLLELENTQTQRNMDNYMREILKPKESVYIHKEYNIKSCKRSASK